MSAPKENKPSEVCSELLDAMRKFSVALAYSTDRQKKPEAEINDIEHRLENRVYKFKASVGIIKHKEGGA